MRLSILGKIINLLLPRYCPVCDNRLLGSEEMLCINCLKHLPLTMTWSDPYEGLAEPRFRTVVNFIFGGSTERMRELAFGNQKVDFESKGEGRNRG